MFFIQTGEDDQILFDFQLELLEQLRICKWAYGESSDVILSQTYNNFKIPDNTFVCPVGSIEFVDGFIKKYYKDNISVLNPPMTPINVPTQLVDKEYTKRIVKKNISVQEVLKIVEENKDKNFYVKSSEQIKGFSHLIYPFNACKELSKLKNGERVDISEDLGLLSSEWRIFIYNNEILDVRRYVGLWNESIDKDFIEKAVNKWSLKPKACTLDIAKTDDGRFIVLEGHNFVSCGTYGFSDSKLPRMIVEGFKWELNKNKII